MNMQHSPTSQAFEPTMLGDISTSNSTRYMSTSLPSLLHQPSTSSSSIGMTSSSSSTSTTRHTTSSPPTTFSNSSVQVVDDTLTMLPLQDQSQEHGKKRKYGDFCSSPSRSPDFVDQPPEHLNCPICQAVFRKPVIVNGCGHEFCEACLEQALANAANCPLCRQPVNTSRPFSTPLRRVQEEVDKLRVRCPFYHEGGCDAILALAVLDDHVNLCPSAVVECHHAVHGCEWGGTRQGLVQHLSECQFEKMKKFTQTTASGITELKSQSKQILTELKRLKTMEGVLKTRGERLRELHKQKSGFGRPGAENDVLVIRVAEKGTVQWMFKVKASTKLGKIHDILQLKQGKPVLLTCDGPLQIGGTVIEKHDTLFDLGLASIPSSPQNGPILFAEMLT
eukprot:c10560_g1_i1.p1 GENE.c10560_g1_i1~~c10560_g1_i1.p1  ORF type:complete len:393 (+),score=70.57 c10560_g1_i1:60-1238(+)